MIEIAAATNRRYLPWCATLMRSCADRHPEGLLLHLLHDGSLGDSDIRLLKEMLSDTGCRLHIPSVDETTLQDLPSLARFGGCAPYLRLLLPKLLPDVSRVLYLDVDAIVVGDLSLLWEEPLHDTPLAAVANVVEPNMYRHVSSLGIDDPKDFFNSGVLLIDLEAVRGEASFDEALRMTRERIGGPWAPDQDALNVVFAGRWHHLHPRWNAMSSFWNWRPWAEEVFGSDAVAEATRDPAILHFEGPSVCKPWHYLCAHPCRDAYRATLARTPWSEVPLEDQTFATRVISRMPEGWQVPAYWRLTRARSRLRPVRRIVSKARAYSGRSRATSSDR